MREINQDQINQDQIGTNITREVIEILTTTVSEISMDERERLEALFVYQRAMPSGRVQFEINGQSFDGVFWKIGYSHLIKENMVLMFEPRIVVEDFGGEKLIDEETKTIFLRQGDVLKVKKFVKN